MWVQGMAVRTLGGDALLVLLDECLTLLEVLVLISQERQALVLLFPVVVGYVAVAAVNSGFRAFRQVGWHFLEFDLQAALAGDCAVRALR